jgi:hypothetical protein
MNTFNEFINALCDYATDRDCHGNPKRFLSAPFRESDWGDNPEFTTKHDFSIKVNEKLSIHIKSGRYDEKQMREWFNLSKK